jgi:hypothetical protein
VSNPVVDVASRLVAADLLELSEAILAIAPDTTVLVVAQGDLDSCETCHLLCPTADPVADPTPANDGAAIVVHQAHDSIWPTRETVCTGCLPRVVAEYPTTRYQVWIEVPATAATTRPAPAIPAPREPRLPAHHAAPTLRLVAALIGSSQ